VGNPWALAGCASAGTRATGAWCACGLMRVISLSESRPAPSEHGRRLIMRLKSSFCKGAFTYCAINDHASQHSSLNPARGTHTLCLSARYAPPRGHARPAIDRYRYTKSFNISVRYTRDHPLVLRRDSRPLLATNAAEPLTRTQCATRFGVSARFGKYSTCMHFAFWQVQYAFWPVLVDCMQMHGTRGKGHGTCMA
jgi:hypothetical protein